MKFYKVVDKDDLLLTVIASEKEITNPSYIEIGFEEFLLLKKMMWYPM